MILRGTGTGESERISMPVKTEGRLVFMYLMCRHHVLREICLQQMEIIQNKHEQDLDTECWRRNKLGSWLYKHTDLCLVLDKI